MIFVRRVIKNEALLDYSRYNDKIPIKVCYDENIQELKIIKNKLKEIIKNV